MRVLHINSSQEGGAAWCAIRINNALIRQGVESRMLFAQGNKLPEGVEGAIAEKDAILKFRSNSLFVKFRHLLMRFPWYNNVEKMQNRLHNVNVHHLYLHQPLSNYTEIVNHPLVEWADIIHLHWVPDFIDYPTFFKRIKKPIVWTLHDQYPILGVMHFESEYTVRPKELDEIDCLCRKIKKKGLSKAESLHVVAISEMMKDIISSSDLLGNYPITLIHNGVDTGIFRRMNDNKSIVSGFISSLEKETKIFLFSSYGIWDKRKGLDRVLEALELVKKINSYNFALVVIGSINKDIQLEASFPVFCSGLVKSQMELAKIYSSVDFFINASYEETYCQTITEAMACGCPVISTPTGVAPDIIQTFNGIICDGFDVSALQRGIQKAVSIKYDAEQIRDYIIEKYDYKIIAQKYIELYTSLYR